MVRWLVAVALALVLAFGARADTSETLPTPILGDFLSWTDYWSPELSPGGRYMAGVRRDGVDHVVVVQDLAAEERSFTGSRVGEYYVNWIEWANEERLLVSLRGFVNVDTGDPVTMEEYHSPEYRRDNRIFAYSRLVAMNRDGSNAVVMFGENRRMRSNWSMGRVTSFLPDDPDHIIMPARMSGDLDLFRVNVNTGETERIARGTARTYTWYVDQNGEPAFRYNTNGRRTVTYIYAREARNNGNYRWRKVKTVRWTREEENRDAATEFRPLQPGDEPGTFFVAARPDGENETAIWLYNFETDTFLEKVAGVDGVDVETALFDRETYAFQGITYRGHRQEFQFVDSSLQAHMDGLTTYFGPQTNVIPVDASGDENRWLIHSFGPSDAGSYHIYDRKLRQVRPIAYSRNALALKRHAPVELIEYVARDGLALHGYLTRPADWNEGDGPAPLVMMPHGGPESRDSFTFHDRAQLLASRGYQVFQPNFRGSSGFGREFADRGRRQWGKDMQTDVDDGFAYLVAEGLADANRACILGASYGGYVAMAAATLTPDLYQCAITINGVSDLEESLKRERREEGSDSEAVEYWTNHIGHHRRDRDAIAAVSPARLADRITRPMLIIYSADDKVVFPEQSEFMMEAMDAAGKPYVSLELKNSSHSSRTVYDERAEYLAILSFLDEHLPVE